MFLYVGHLSYIFYPSIYIRQLRRKLILLELRRAARRPWKRYTKGHALLSAYAAASAPSAAGTLSGGNISSGDGGNGSVGSTMAGSGAISANSQGNSSHLAVAAAAAAAAAAANNNVAAAAALAGFGPLSSASSQQQVMAAILQQQMQQMAAQNLPLPTNNHFGTANNFMGMSSNNSNGNPTSKLTR